MSGSMAVDRSLTDEGRFARSNFADLVGHNKNRAPMIVGITISVL